jgi:restriction endonuclease S subunit
MFQARGSRNLAFVLRGVPATTVASNHFYIVRAKSATVLPEYLAWFVNQPSAQGHLTGKAQGTTMMLVPKEAFESLEVDLPPLDVQRAIVELAELRQRERALVQNLECKRDTLIRALSLRAIARGTD